MSWQIIKIAAGGKSFSITIICIIGKWKANFVVVYPL